MSKPLAYQVLHTVVCQYGAVQFNTHLCDIEKCVFLFNFDDAQMLSWLGKFLYTPFRSKSVQLECLQDMT